MAFRLHLTADQRSGLAVLLAMAAPAVLKATGVSDDLAQRVIAEAGPAVAAAAPRVQSSAGYRTDPCATGSPRVSVISAITTDSPISWGVSDERRYQAQTALLHVFPYAGGCPGA